jgi:hypothetical protein
MMLAQRSEKLQEHASIALRVRRIVAFPLYVVALVMTFAGDFLGRVAEKIAGDS